MQFIKAVWGDALHIIKQWLGRKPKRTSHNDSIHSPTLQNPQPFQPYPDHVTDSPRFNYTFFAYGSLPTSQKVAVHYLRIRPFMGGRDPAIYEGVPNRQRLTRAILETTLAAENKCFWKALLCNPPTHTLRLGFVWRKTGEAVDVIYMPVCLYQPGHSPEALARECAKHLMGLLQKQRILRLLCPPPERMRVTQIFWLSMLFLHWRWLVCDRYRVEPL